jgi:hypothetical protein
MLDACWEIVTKINFGYRFPTVLAETRKMCIRVIMLVLCEEGRTYGGSVTVRIGISPVVRQTSYVHNKGIGFSCGMVHFFLYRHHITSR